LHALTDPHQAGGAAEVSVLIRPEQITLTGTGHGSDASPQESEDAVTGKVTDTHYHGHDVLVTVDVVGVGPVQARLAGAEPPLSGDEVVLTVGGPVTAWPAAERDPVGASAGQ
jgi:iron(III) transport system ATP-binding protein